MEYDPDQLRSLQMEARNIHRSDRSIPCGAQEPLIEQFEKDKAIAAKTRRLQRAERDATKAGVAEEIEVDKCTVQSR